MNPVSARFEEHRSRPLRALFMVGARRGYLTLRATIEAGIEICGVTCFRQHAHEMDRYEQCIAELAHDADIPYCETSLLQEHDYADLIRSELKPDIAYLIGVRAFVSAHIYEAIPYGAFAAHDSLLPRYRGFAPLNWSILNGESETGVTLFRLGEGVDEGPIVGQRRVPIGEVEGAGGGL
jgi:methionyl-tRNA formyltransferase